MQNSVCLTETNREISHTEVWTDQVKSIIQWINHSLSTCCRHLEMLWTIKYMKHWWITSMAASIPHTIYTLMLPKRWTYLLGLELLGKKAAFQHEFQNCKAIAIANLCTKKYNNDRSIIQWTRYGQHDRIKCRHMMFTELNIAIKHTVFYVAMKIFYTVLPWILMKNRPKCLNEPSAMDTLEFDRFCPQIRSLKFEIFENFCMYVNIEFSWVQYS